MTFFQARFDKVKLGRKYYIFLKKRIVRVEVVSSWEDYNYTIWGQIYSDLGVRIKRVDNQKHLPRLRSCAELYTRNGS